MITFSLELNAILENFSKLKAIKEKGEKCSDAYQNLFKCLEKSKTLLKTTEQAIAAGELKQFNLMHKSKNDIATYQPNSKTINFKLSALEEISHEADLVFAFGREIGTANNYDLARQISHKFKLKTTLLAKKQGIRDYTILVKEALNDHAQDKGVSQLAGWNALVGYMFTQNPQLTLQDIYTIDGTFKSHFFNEKGQLKRGYLANINLHLNPTYKNMAATKAHFFEEIHNTLEIENTNYNDLYSHYYIDKIIIPIEEKYQSIGVPVLDLQHLGLSPQRMLEIQEKIKTFKTLKDAKESEYHHAKTSQRNLLAQYRQLNQLQLQAQQLQKIRLEQEILERSQFSKKTKNH